LSTDEVKYPVLMEEKIETGGNRKERNEGVEAWREQNLLSRNVKEK
jgi:hypothetical protein